MGGRGTINQSWCRSPICTWAPLTLLQFVKISDDKVNILRHNWSLIIIILYVKQMQCVQYIKKVFCSNKDHWPWWPCPEKGTLTLMTFPWEPTFSVPLRPFTKCNWQFQRFLQQIFRFLVDFLFKLRVKLCFLWTKKNVWTMEDYFKPFISVWFWFFYGYRGYLFLIVSALPH